MEVVGIVSIGLWPCTYLFTLGNQLARVELRDDALEDLVHDRGEHALIVVLAKLAVDGRERGRGWAGQDTASDVHHLQVCGSSVTKFRGLRMGGAGAWRV